VSREPINFLPGPVAMHPAVREAFARPAVSHRSIGFLALVEGLRERLRQRTGAAHVEMLLGSGTLANEAVAAQLSLLPGSGLVLTNGEFGERLLAQARRWRLPCRELAAAWGEPLPYRELERSLEEDTGIRWVWAVHCETSTGVLNDLLKIQVITTARGVLLCVDAISSLGNVQVDFSQVAFATGVSGKGLASFPGLGLVFHDRPVAPSPRLPHYLDLGSYALAESVPFTTSTNLAAALAASLERGAGLDGFAARRALASWLRPRLEEMAVTVMAPREIAAPMVLTLVLPPGARALALGEALEAEGIWLSYRSGYLVERNLLQICLMGEHDRAELEVLLETLERLLRPARAPAGPSF
jgi:aspartate aminotransferase-like enzyme